MTSGATYRLKLNATLGPSGCLPPLSFSCTNGRAWHPTGVSARMSEYRGRPPLPSHLPEYALYILIRSVMFVMRLYCVDAVLCMSSSLICVRCSLFCCIILAERSASGMPLMVPARVISEFSSMSWRQSSSSEWPWS